MTNTRNPDAIRNVALIGGPKTGKTSLSEALLFAAGSVKRLGSVTEGTTLSDHLPEEKDKQHSIHMSLLPFETKGTRFNVIDAPGYPDFIGEAAAALAPCEVALLCVNAEDGLTFPGRKAWDLASGSGRARAVVVTHLDGGACEDFGAFVEDLGEKLGARCLPVVVPRDAELSGVSRVPLGGEAEGELAARRDALVEAVVEVDEEAMLAFLEEDTPPTEADAARLLRRSMVAGEVVPVLCCNPLDGTGVDELLEVLKACAPSPVDGPFYETEAGEVVTPDADGPSAFVFKTIIDQHIGKLCMLRVVSGAIAQADSLRLARTDKPIKLGNLQSVFGKEHHNAEAAGAGDLVAVAKVDDLETGDTLTAPGKDWAFAPFPAPKPMVTRAIETASAGDEAKMITALRKADAEDRTFVCERNEATGELVVHGVSTMHLETVLRGLKQRFGVELGMRIPRVPYKESCSVKADGHHRHKKQTGGRGQFAEVFLWLQPAERGTGLDFQDDTVGGSIPKNYMPAVEKGIVEEMNRGILAGCLVEDVEVHVTDGKFHDVDSDEASFKLAGARAFRDAFLKSNPVLLEPVYEIEVHVPVRFMGAITSDLNTRRAQIQGMDSVADTQIVRARAPIKEILTYSTALYSLTQGEGHYSMEFHDYEVMPPNVQQEVMAEYASRQKAG